MNLIYLFSISLLTELTSILFETPPKDVPRSFSLLFGLKRGVYGSSWKHIFDYLRPSFHPNDYDTSAFLDYYKERLLHPETGVLTPYFTKEFTPVLKS